MRHHGRHAPLRPRRLRPWQLAVERQGTGSAHLRASRRREHAGNDRCYGSWADDRGGRKWLRQAPPTGFEPATQLLAAVGCVTALNFYPGFAGRFHKVWEKEYWPCKAACTQEPSCARSYYEKHMWRCKASALAAHDAAVHLPADQLHSLPPLNVTPPCARGLG